jgi:hypothetical protein
MRKVDVERGMRDGEAMTVLVIARAIPQDSPM